ncbi:putative Type I restriction-modification system methyltransferase subunit [Vibrio nigripulchritudo SFn27]|uniref:Putative Type I restriction-modification system methyltransferase subunit n=1 Tax=Vibrio nigripulchritudo TaxID=28173 RepID=U4K308_9VIBR|nr:N-6 DNA methylase [Vibrio nigripulchritudo]CCN83489.1 putative Type I restriction-modification system methyltransferase subunit [Vibrio nigripulchritudo BLFn1]CCN90973.1 putative Type I restriction-modification system methyltransferase subunit [Vibrio nigripulchritudo SFn27]CCN95199.1 putative Type I restriction-modification system methyltransferase subunit [Vibrio nigripulchritudo ENn2]CCO42319.1 putative Type I restriction-modification system methyltransferase subunit [Vibrio nigripulchrit
MVELNQYYTSEATSSLLASMLDVEHIQSCLELSAGEGALIEPIKELNQAVRFTTVDLDIQNTSKLRTIYPNDIHICSDALDLDLNINANSFDLAVCNPPFAYTELNEKYKLILGDDFLPIFIGNSKIRMEVLFILRNLFFLKKGATLAIIIPDFIYSSNTLSKFRETLFSKYTLFQIIECEHKSFKKTEAKTYILFIKKAKPKSNNESLPHLVLSSGTIKNSKLSIKSTFSNLGTKDIEGYKIFRGSSSSKNCRLTKKPFHHNYAHVEDLSKISYPSNTNMISGFKYAIKGDILIHRVGRNVGRTVFLDSKEVIVSDCIIVLRFQDKNLKQVFWEHWSSRKEEWILRNQKGTCAKNISISSIKDFISSLT